MKPDISTREDIVLLVNTFYDKVKANALIGYIFNDVAKVNWQEHLPKMYSFWASMLLDEHSYSGNPMIKHIELSKITKLTKVEFSEWLRLFNETVDELFEGTTANEAKARGANIARLMLYKIQSV
jgi:hemoglobin